MYYSENYPRAMKVYEAVMSRNSRTKRVLKAAEKEAGNVLEAFLILPIQRIPRYILLLKVRRQKPHLCVVTRVGKTGNHSIFSSSSSGFESVD